jgi:histidine ammonia-lyase
MRTLLAGSGLAVEHGELRRALKADPHRLKAIKSKEPRRPSRKNGTHPNGVQRTEVYLQKAYTLRAIPQVVGAVRDAAYHARATLEIELNSSNDNPLVFEGKEVFHGANFHGQPIAFVMDYTTIALTQLGVFSERRTNRLLNRYLSNGLPEFLVAGDPGLNSGFAGAQYPATALVAENRTIAPASTQSVPSNGDNQDVVSMGLIATRNARRVLENNCRILAVEYLAAAQAVDVSGRADRLSPAGRVAYETVRSLVPMVKNDRYMADDIELVAAALSRGELAAAVARAGVELR